MMTDKCGFAMHVVIWNSKIKIKNLLGNNYKMPQNERIKIINEF